MQKNNNGKYYVTVNMIHKHVPVLFTYVCWDYSVLARMYICTKSPGDKTIAILYTNRNIIDMIRLVGLHVRTAQNKNMEYSMLRRH